MSRNLRMPAVSGAFYPAASQELERLVDSYLGRAITGQAPAKAVICPHAGYVYSGAVTGEVLGSIEVPSRVVLLGPKHRRAGAPAAVDSSAAWRFPFGDVELDRPLCDAVASLPGLESDSTAHRDEHSLEVQVPFLFRRCRHLRITPILLGHEVAPRLAEIGDGIARAIRETGEQVLILASTDMSHYLPQERARQRDSLALGHIDRLDPAGLLSTVMSNDITMCGVVPTVAALYAAVALGAEKATLVRYTTSAETSGDSTSVVGYAGYVVR